MRKLLATLALGVALAFGAPDAAEAQSTKQDGLVNVVVGDITIAEDVNIAAAVGIAAQLCPAVDVGQINILATQVDQSSRTRVVCRLQDGDKVRFVQN